MWFLIDSGFGGTVMQYQVLLDPARIYGAWTHGLLAPGRNCTGDYYARIIRRLNGRADKC
jgi:hypothetical protein